jgi:hypothetical protein
MPNIRNIQSATGSLIMGIDPARDSAPLGASIQALSIGTSSNLWWYSEDVPGRAGYLWLHNAETVDVIGINPQGGTGSGAQLQSQRQAAVDTQWWTTEDVPGKPGYFYLKSAANGLVIDINNAGGIHSGSRLQVLDQKNEDNQYWTWVEVPHVVESGLKSSNNYFLFGGYDQQLGYIALNEVVISINITDDLIGNPPCSLQLNCWSPKPNRQEERADGGLYDVWQQYGLSWEPGFGNLVGSYAENWPQDNGPNLFNLVPSGFWSIEDNGTKIPAGTLITIILSQLNGASGPISGSFVVVANGSSAQSQTINLIGQPLAGGGPITAKDLAPIAAMQMNIVAWGTPAGQPSPTTIFTKGAGTIQYFSTTPMTVVSGPPSDVAAPNTITGENSNCTYGTLPKGTSKLYVQTFGHS